VEKGGLARPGLTGEVHVAAGLADVLKGEFQLGVGGGGHGLRWFVLPGWEVVATASRGEWMSIVVFYAFTVDYMRLKTGNYF
jgi:hypothetical protein